MREKLNDEARLDLIREAIGKIETFLEGTTTCESFVANKLLCHAVIYNLQCIGECAYKLSRDYVAGHPEMDWEAIEGLRHVLVHDYYTVNMNKVWAILEKDVPELKRYLRSL